MRYDLRHAVRHDGIALDAVILRTPTKQDQAAIMKAAEVLAREKGRELTDRDGFVLMIAQLADLPLDAVRKLSATDAQALAGIVNRLFAERGMG